MPGSVTPLPTQRAVCSFAAPLGMLQAAPCLRHTLPAFRSTERAMRLCLLGRPLKGGPLPAYSHAGRLLQTHTGVLSCSHQQNGLHIPEKTLLLQRSSKCWTCTSSVCRGLRGPQGIWGARGLALALEKCHPTGFCLAQTQDFSSSPEKSSIMSIWLMTHPKWKNSVCYIL